MVIQFIATGIILVIIGQLITKVLKDKMSFLKISLWVIFWSLGLIVIWLPQETLNELGEIVGVGRGIDVLVYLSILLLFYNNLRLNEKIDKLDSNITKVVREVSKKNTNS